eukprot:136008_1
MGCITSLPSNSNHESTYPSTIPSISEMQSSTISHINVSEMLRSSSVETDNDRELEVPVTFQKWFPPTRHAHTNIRDLFEFHREISHSETSSVHEITYKSEICVLKQIVKDHPRGRMLFETEAHILSQLCHANIIGYIDMFFDEEYYYLLVEKAECDLFSVLKNKGRLSEETTRNITYQLLQALRHIHRRNLVHRDLKPENIVFISAENTEHPLLIDFGDAECTQKDKEYTECVGTPPYMSPERSYGHGHHGWQLKKSDIFAIGTIAYEMYCGQRCFVGGTREDVVRRVLNGEWSWPSDRIPSEEFKQFVEQCLHADAKDRPSAKQALCHLWFDTVHE